MKIPQYRYDENVVIYNIGDVHRGDNLCDIGGFLKVVKKVDETPNALWVSTGDLLNVALKTSKSDCYSSLSLQNELDRITNELAPIRSKCLGFVASNHHNRLNNLTGLNLDEVVADKLKVPYLGKLGLINVTCGRAAYYIALHHGVGGGKRRGSKTNNLEDLYSLMPSADIYLEGHTHAFDYFINEIPYIDRKRLSVGYHRAHFVTTGHFIKWEDSYAQDYKLRPMPLGSAVISLSSASTGLNSLKKIDVSFFQV